MCWPTKMRIVLRPGRWRRLFPSTTIALFMFCKCATEWHTATTAPMKCLKTACYNNAEAVRFLSCIHCTCTLQAVMCSVLGYVRCGSESGQCIRLVDMCNGMNDCLNGWDEKVSTCLSEMEHALLADEMGRKALQYSM